MPIPSAGEPVARRKPRAREFLISSGEAPLAMLEQTAIPLPLARRHCARFRPSSHADDGSRREA